MKTLRCKSKANVSLSIPHDRKAVEVETLIDLVDHLGALNDIIATTIISDGYFEMPCGDQD